MQAYNISIFFFFLIFMVQYIDLSYEGCEPLHLGQPFEVVLLPHIGKGSLPLVFVCR